MAFVRVGSDGVQLALLQAEANEPSASRTTWHCGFLILKWHWQRFAQRNSVGAA